MFQYKLYMQLDETWVPIFRDNKPDEKKRYRSNTKQEAIAAANKWKKKLDTSVKIHFLKPLEDEIIV